MNEYEDRTLKIKAEFINFLRINLKNRSDKNIAQQEVRSLVYRFIIDKIFASIEVETKKEKKRMLFDLFIDVIDFCLSYGGVIIQTISTIKEYKDFEEFEINDSGIDA